MPTTIQPPVTVLAIDTSSKLGSVAVQNGNRLLAEKSLDLGQQHAQSLVPGLRDLLTGCGLSLRSVTLVAVSIGPGSFTGLRVGVTVAKLLAYANAVPVIGVPTFLTIAEQTVNEQTVNGAEVSDQTATADSTVQALPKFVTVIADAQRQELFVQRFAVHGDRAGQHTAPLPQAISVQQVGPLSIHAVAEWLSSVTAVATATDVADHVVTGPALEQFSNWQPGELARRLQAAGVRVAQRANWMPGAATVGRLAIAAAARGEISDPKTLEPLYGRRSSAEDKWDSRTRNA